MLFARPRKDLLITMLSDGRRRFVVAHELSEQPSWAFAIGNGSEELFLHKNAGKATLTLRSKKTSTEVSANLTNAQARDMHASLIRAIDESGFDVRRKEKAILTPLGSAASHEGTRLTCKASDE